MPRHLQVRNREDSFSNDYELSEYGPMSTSVDDQYDWPASPSVSQFIHPAAGGTSFSNFIKTVENSKAPGIPEEEASSDSDVEDLAQSFDATSLSESDREKLKSSMLQVQNVVGDSFTLCDSFVAQTLIKFNFNVDQTIDALVSSPRDSDKKKPVFFSPSPAAVVIRSPVVTTSSGDVIGTKRTLNFDHLELAPTYSDASVGELQDKRTSAKAKEPPVVKLASNVNPNTSDPPLYNSQLSNFKSQNSKTVLENSTVAPLDDEPVLDEKTRALIEEECRKATLSIVVIGHVDAGKSTLVGHLLYKIGSVSKKEINKFEQESKKEGKSSFALAWVMDENASERSRGVTMEISERFFETSNYYVTIVDAPGHKDFIPAMITGAAEADAALLVIDASVNAFESGFNAKDISLGQTSEHSVLARSLGVTHMIVVVNKIDTCNSPKERMQEIENTLTPFLTKKAGFKPTDIQFLPCSGFYGKNIKEKDYLDWYSGPTLLEAIDSLPAPARPVDQPLCMAITDTVKVSSNNVTVSGIVKSGFVRHNEKVLLQPANISSVIKGIKVLDKTGSGPVVANAPIAVAGSHIHCILNVDSSAVTPGSFVCAHTNNNQTMLVTNCFQARIITFNSDEFLTRGSAAEMHYICLQEPVYVKKIISLLDKSGAVSKRNPKFVPKNSSALVVLTLQRNICVQLFKTSKHLGRFMLRLNGVTVAAGIVDKVA